MGFLHYEQCMNFRIREIQSNTVEQGIDLGLVQSKYIDKQSVARAFETVFKLFAHRRCCSEGVTTGGSLYCDGGVEWTATSPKGGRRLLLDAASASTIIALSAECAGAIC